MVARCVNKMLRHMYNTYCAMGLKFALYGFEFFRTSSFYILYLVEYALINVLVIEALPEV